MAREETCPRSPAAAKRIPPTGSIPTVSPAPNAPSDQPPVLRCRLFRPKSGEHRCTIAMSPSPSIRSRRSRKVRVSSYLVAAGYRSVWGQADPQQSTAGGVGISPGVSTPIMRPLMPTRCSSIARPMASGGLLNDRSTQPAATRDTVFPALRHSCRSSYDLNGYLYRQRRGTLPVDRKPGRRLCRLRPAAGYRQRQSAPP